MEQNNKDTNAKGSNQQSSSIPESTSSKPMDSKRDVENSNDEKIDQDFPGYPHYPAKDDIMDQRTDNHRVDADVENLPNSHNVTGVDQRFSSTNDADRNKDNSTSQSVAAGNIRPEDDFRDIAPRTELTTDGLETLGSTNAEIGIPQNADNDDLNKRTSGTDLEADSDLDFSRSTDADVTPDERAALENISMPTNDENNLTRAALDNTDFDGEQLNEDSFGEVLSNRDLDIPDETDETRTTSLGQGDEENKYYSLGSDRHESQEEDPYSGPVRDNDA